MLPWIRFAGRKNSNFDQAPTDLFTVLFILGLGGSCYKTNCDFETPIAHYIGGVGRKYILVPGGGGTQVYK